MWRPLREPSTKKIVFNQSKKKHPPGFLFPSAPCRSKCLRSGVTLYFMRLTQNELQYLREFFAVKPVEKAFLFGSYSRGSADDTSDIDILLELDYSHHIGMGLIKMKFELEDALKRKVDLVTRPSISKDLLPIIDQDKLLIYERPVR